MEEIMILLGEVERDILASTQTPRTAVRHSPARIDLLYKPRAIPCIDNRIMALSRSPGIESAKVCAGLAALRDWIRIRCDAPSPAPVYSLSCP